MAEKLNIPRRTLYEIFKKDSIDLDIIHRLSGILEIDLINEYYKYIEKKAQQKEDKTHFKPNELKIFHISYLPSENKYPKIYFVKKLISEIKTKVLYLEKELNEIKEILKQMEENL
ncbi:MAG: hypothetical protein N3A01_08935 [Bacteroidales bacterium]|nr:hypothetical protein [Bacteroidales bacterium]